MKEKAKKIIFLDIDGVLNSRATRARTPGGFVGVSTILIKCLMDIVKETGAEIVLSSDWKDGWENSARDGKYLEEKLSDFNLKITGRTYEENYYQRGRGILDYLAVHNVESYVILDDREFDFFECGLDTHFINVDPAYGLTKANVYSAINILMKKS